MLGKLMYKLRQAVDSSFILRLLSENRGLLLFLTMLALLALSISGLVFSIGWYALVVIGGAALGGLLGASLLLGFSVVLLAVVYTWFTGV